MQFFKKAPAERIEKRFEYGRVALIVCALMDKGLLRMCLLRENGEKSAAT